MGIPTVPSSQTPKRRRKFGFRNRNCYFVVIWWGTFEIIQFISISLQSEQQNTWIGKNSAILMPLVRNSSVQCSTSTKQSQESGYYLEDVELHVHTVATFIYSTLSVATSSFSSMVDVEPPITRTCNCMLYWNSANRNWPIYCAQHIMKGINSWPKLGSYESKLIRN